MSKDLGSHISAGGGGWGGSDIFFQKKNWMEYKKEIKDRELLLFFMFVCLFVCSQIAQYQQGHFGLIADCFALNLINTSSSQKSRNLQTFVWLGGKYSPTAYKRVGTTYVFGQKMS